MKRLMVAAFLGAITAPPVWAQGCSQAVEAYAERQGIAGGKTELAAPRSLSDQLAGTGGVIQPPQVGRTPEIEPPDGTSRMPTQPAIEPQAGPERGDRAESSAGPAHQAKVAGLLDAARAAAHRGDESECTAKLDEAARLDQPD